jgi:trimeric autotransporter adhesin
MALKTWMPRARAVAEVHTITPANVEVGDVFTITINGKTVSFTATATTVANVTAGLAAAWALATEAEFTEITASDQTTHLRLTHNTRVCRLCSRRRRPTAAVRTIKP